MALIGIIYDEVHELLPELNLEIRRLGHSVQFIHWSDLSRCYTDTGIVAWEKNVSIAYLDRAAERRQCFASQIYSLDKFPSPIINEPHAYWKARDKTAAAKIFCEQKLPFPKTFIAHTQKQIEYFCANVGSWIIKSALGVGGEEVVAGSKTMDDDYRSAVSQWLVRDGHVVVQEFIKGSEKCIWRVDIVGEKITSVTKIYAANQAHLLPICNESLGGSTQVLSRPEIPKNICDLSFEAANAFSLDVCGIDFIQDVSGNFVICEINPEPDLPLFRTDFSLELARFLVRRIS